MRVREMRKGLAARRIAGLAILLAAAAAQIFFNNLPWPLTVEDNKKLQNLTANAQAMELVLTGSALADTRPLLTYDGTSGETVDLDFKAAQPDDQTRGIVFSLSPTGAPAANMAEWHLVESDSPKDSEGQPCRVHVEIGPDGGTSLGELHFTQLADPASDHRVIDMTADSTALLVSFKNEAPDAAKPYGPGCLKLAGSGAWQMPVRNAPLRFRVAPKSHFWVTFVAVTDKPAWRGSGGVLKTVLLGSLSAQDITLRPIREDGEPEKAPAALELSGVKGSPLKVSKLQVGLDSLQVSLDGRAWAHRDGHILGFDLWDAVQRNYFLTALLTGANGLLLSWLHKLCFPRRQRKTRIAAA